MHLDSTSEYDALLADISTTPRLQPYRHIHKALRRLLTQALVDVGACDVRRPDERAKLIQTVDFVLGVCADHIAHENRYFHEPLRRRTLRATLAFDHDHDNQLQVIASLRHLLDRLREADADASALAYRIYLAFGEFVAENLQHMTEEETVLTRALWQHMSDAEILEMETVLRANLTREQSEAALRWMAASLNGEELENLLADAQHAAPPAVFAGLLDIVRSELDLERSARLVQALEVRGNAMAVMA